MKHQNQAPLTASDTQMMSLYDYLGRPAGPTLGQQVYQGTLDEYNKPTVPIAERQISLPTYTGKVLLYPKWYLDAFFRDKTTAKLSK